MGTSTGGYDSARFHGILLLIKTLILEIITVHNNCLLVLDSDKK